MKFKFIALMLTALVALPFAELKADGFEQQKQAVLDLGNLTAAPGIRDAGGRSVSVAAGETKAIYFDAFAIPTYGAGCLHRIENQYRNALADDELFQAVWDPMVRISRAEMPALWLSWPRVLISMLMEMA